MPRLRVKICCISDADEMRAAVRAGADALGFVSAMATGPGVIDEDRIAAMATGVPPPVARVLLTSALDADAIVAQALLCRPDVLQLVDYHDADILVALRTALPSIRLMPVVHVTGDESVDLARRLAESADALLLDSGNPYLPVKELGGTGRVHDWAISRTIVDTVPCPVFLAGGLRPDNVAQAVAMVRPFGLDICTGVRTGGRLDVAKLEAFMSAVRAL
ncbi:phosphoribosylanthranilate isomerase [Marinivivus vitaminiproducens]|uniref:phosphoribosylanthranilate isomerase n=1 Tax=Marinivivus vitaminiproducens TaxID=3035935 RepID=UPI00279DDCA0|nr:phosphoribosylanthranilate isomerase [Geminicoccaceae bacterium SCSIO 64248]